MTSIQLPFDRLKGSENFTAWKVGAKACLISKGYWKNIQDGLESSANAAEKTADAKALAELTLMLDPSMYSHIQDATTAKDGWDKILAVFEDKGAARKVSILKQWVTLKLTDFDSMQAYVTKSLEMKHKVTNAGLTIDEELAGSIMLCGLTEEFKPMVRSIETTTSKLTSDYVKKLVDARN